MGLVPRAVEKWHDLTKNEWCEPKAWMRHPPALTGEPPVQEKTEEKPVTRSDQPQPQAITEATNAR